MAYPTKITEQELLLLSYLNQTKPPQSFIGNPYRKDKTYLEFPVERDTLYRYAVLRRMLRYTVSGLPRPERESRSGTKYPSEAQQMEQAFQAGRIVDTGKEIIILTPQDFRNVEIEYQEVREYISGHTEHLLASWNSKKRKQMLDLAGKEGHAAFQYHILNQEIASSLQKHPENKEMKILHWWIRQCYARTVQENKENREAGKNVQRMYFSEQEVNAYQFVQDHWDRLQTADVRTALTLAGRKLRDDIIDLEHLLWLHNNMRFQGEFCWNGYTFPIQASPFMEKPICWTSMCNFTAAIFPPTPNFKVELSSLALPYFEHTDGAIATIRFSLGKNLIWEELQSDLPFLLRRTGKEISEGLHKIILAWPEIAYQAARVIQQKLKFPRMYATLPYRIIEHYGARVHSKKVYLYDQTLRKYSHRLMNDQFGVLDAEPQYYRLFEL